MLPIAVLPVAALLLRLGQPDLLDVPAIAAAGDAIFSNLGLLFAIGVAVGLAKREPRRRGARGRGRLPGRDEGRQGAHRRAARRHGGVPGQSKELAAAAFRAKELAKLSVPVGLLSGLIAGWAYNRYNDIRLPSYLAFFGGRRFVPIVSGIAGLVLALVFGFGWQTLEHGMDAMSQAVLDSEEIGLFAYGVLNRVLIVTGLHHIINNIAWFLLGDYNGVTGDLKRFFAGDPTAGAFMSGFFPVMMFGLPGACLAMYRTALPERREAVGGLLFSMALTSFLTGVTEPIEFAFMFLAPVLYAIHAVLTGIAMVLMHALDVHLGFGFSAGLFDYVLNFSLSTRPLLLIPIGLAYFALYYVAVPLVHRALRPEDARARSGRLGDRGGATPARIPRRRRLDPRARRRRQPAGGRSLHDASEARARESGPDRRAGAVVARFARRAAPGRWRRAGGRRPDRRSARVRDPRAVARSGGRAGRGDAGQPGRRRVGGRRRRQGAGRRAPTSASCQATPAACS